MQWRFLRTEEMESKTTLPQLSPIRDLTVVTAELISISKEAHPTKSQTKIISDNMWVAYQAKASGWSHSSRLTACSSKHRSRLRQRRLCRWQAQTRSPHALMWLAAPTRRSSIWTANLLGFQTQASEVPKVPRATVATALRLRKRFLEASQTTLTKMPTLKSRLNQNNVKIKRKKVDQIRPKTAARWIPCPAQTAFRSWWPRCLKKSSKSSADWTSIASIKQDAACSSPSYIQSMKLVLCRLMGPSTPAWSIAWCPSSPMSWQTSSVTISARR